MADTNGTVRTATCRASSPIALDTGTPLTAATFTTRVGYLADHTARIGQKVLSARWNKKSITLITADTLPDGDTKSPKRAHAHIGALWGWATVPAGTSSRVTRMAYELAGRQLRSAAYRLNTFDDVLAGVNYTVRGDETSVRAMYRRVGKYKNTHGALPKSLFDLEPKAPRVPALVPLAVSDTQFHTMVHNPDLSQVVITLKLPTRARPTSKTHWTTVQFTVNIPTAYRGGRVRPPTLRITGKGTKAYVAVDLPVDFPVDKPFDNGVAVGFDWGAGRMLTGTVGRRVFIDGKAYTVTDGRPLFFDPSGLLAEVADLKRQREMLATKLAHQNKLIAGRVAQQLPPDPVLEAKAVEFNRQIKLINSKQRHRNDQIARLAARWAVEQALAAGAGSIFLEDLASMEHRGLGKRINEMVSRGLRGKIHAAIHDAGVLAGLLVKDVPAKGTSKYCPRCERKLVHRTHAKGGLGYAWATCACGLSLDRDHAAAENIVKRGLTPGSKRVRRRAVKKTKLVTPPKPKGSAKTAPKGRATPARPIKSSSIKGLCAGRVTTQTPTPVGYRSSVLHPSPPAVSGGQVYAEVLLHTSTRSRGVDGLRYAYRQHLKATPVLYAGPLVGVGCSV